MLCVLILYISGRTYSSKSTPNDRFLEKLFMAILFILRVFARNLLTRNLRRNTFCILFVCLVSSSNPGFISNRPTLYLLEYGDHLKVYMLLFDYFSNFLLGKHFLITNESLGKFLKFASKTFF